MSSVVGEVLPVAVSSRSRASLASQAWRPSDGLTGGTPVSRATTRPSLVIIISSPPCASLTSLARSDCVFSNVAVIAALKHFQGESQLGEIAPLRIPRLIKQIDRCLLRRQYPDPDVSARDEFSSRMLTSCPYCLN